LPDEVDEALLEEICDAILDLELTLREGETNLPTSSADFNWDDKIINFLKSPLVKFDLENALFLCKQYQFKKGELLLYERLSLYFFFNLDMQIVWRFTSKQTILIR
jgi:hypothetical protein